LSAGWGIFSVFFFSIVRLVFSPILSGTPSPSGFCPLLGAVVPFPCHFHLSIARPLLGEPIEPLRSFSHCPPSLFVSACGCVPTSPFSDLHNLFFFFPCSIVFFDTIFWRFLPVILLFFGDFVYSSVLNVFLFPPARTFSHPPKLITRVHLS